MDIITEFMEILQDCEGLEYYRVEGFKVFVPFEHIERFNEFLGAFIKNDFPEVKCEIDCVHELIYINMEEITDIPKEDLNDLKKYLAELEIKTR